MFSRELLKEAEDKLVEQVVVPEWDDTVFFIRRLGGTERSAFEESLIEERVTRDSKGRRKTIRKVAVTQAKAKLVVLACVTSMTDNTPFFQPDDWSWLSDKSAAALERLYKVAERLAGMSQEDMDDITGN